MDYYKNSLMLHEQNKGKWEVNSKVPVESMEDLSLAYTPGVAQPCIEIASNREEVYKYTAKWNTVAIATDGSAALGLGNIGGLAALPIMEGKAVLFKKFANIDAISICLNTQDTNEIIETLKHIAPSFGGINLEDISAPRCFEIERKLQEEVDIPVFHDDQHGTAIVVLAAAINSAKLLRKNLEEMEVVISGAGAAGTAIAEILNLYGVKDIVLCDSKGIIDETRKDINSAKRQLCRISNKKKIRGTMKEAVKGKDIFIGVSQPRILTEEMVKSMNEEPIIFALSNPEPEILPELAKKAGAAVVGTGRSDYPNQINNLLAFPGVFRGALDARAGRVTMEMKLAAAKAIAETLSEAELKPEQILPTVFDGRVVKNVSEGVAKSWIGMK